MNFVTLTWSAHHPVQMCFVLQSTHWLLAEKTQTENPSDNPEMTGEAAARLGFPDPS